MSIQSNLLNLFNLGKTNRTFNSNKKSANNPLQLLFLNYLNKNGLSGLNTNVKYYPYKSNNPSLYSSIFGSNKIPENDIFGYYFGGVSPFSLTTQDNDLIKYMSNTGTKSDAKYYDDLETLFANATITNNTTATDKTKITTTTPAITATNTGKKATTPTVTTTKKVVNNTGNAGTKTTPKQTTTAQKNTNNANTENKTINNQTTATQKQTNTAAEPAKKPQTKEEQIKLYREIILKDDAAMGIVEKQYNEKMNQLKSGKNKDGKALTEEEKAQLKKDVAAAYKTITDIRTEKDKLDNICGQSYKTQFRLENEKKYWDNSVKAEAEKYQNAVDATIEGVAKARGLTSDYIKKVLNNPNDPDYAHIKSLVDSSVVNNAECQTAYAGLEDARKAKAKVEQELDTRAKVLGEASQIDNKMTGSAESLDKQYNDAIAKGDTDKAAKLFDQITKLREEKEKNYLANGYDKDGSQIKSAEVLQNDIKYWENSEKAEAEKYEKALKQYGDKDPRTQAAYAALEDVRKAKGNAQNQLKAIEQEKTGKPAAQTPAPTPAKTPVQTQQPAKPIDWNKVNQEAAAVQEKAKKEAEEAAKKAEQDKADKEAKAAAEKILKKLSLIEQVRAFQGQLEALDRDFNNPSKNDDEKRAIYQQIEAVRAQKAPLEAEINSLS